MIAAVKSPATPSDLQQPGALLSPAQVKELLQKTQTHLVDVREPDEWNSERIEGSRNFPLSRFQPDELQALGGTLVLHCLSGARQADATKRLLAAGLPHVYQLEGGLKGWKAAGMPTKVKTTGTTMSIMRQVQITIGAVNLLGFGLAYAVNPMFLIIPAFTSAGLLFAGVTGTCALATILGMMPWNGGKASGASCAR